jgi:hypothetical protein
MSRESVPLDASVYFLVKTESSVAKTQWVDPTLSTPAIGKGPYQTGQFKGTKAGGCDCGI